ncbi:MAG: DUF4276 family protein [Planctomycetes bacterium]|nr:DUF4276 family protein [Planctomycetota bacterium]
MPKRVVVIASGETERQALPELTRQLAGEGIVISRVLKPPAHRSLNVEIVKKLILSEWFGNPSAAPDKFVVLLDTDHKPIEKVRDRLLPVTRQVPQVTVPILVACAVPHLEAWFFADEQGLRGFLGRDLGAVDASSPDQIQNPKMHLSQLLGRPYTAQVARRIATGLAPAAIRGRSPSFKSFEDAVRDGGGNVDEDGR